MRKSSRECCLNHGIDLFMRKGFRLRRVQFGLNLRWRGGAETGGSANLVGHLFPESIGIGGHSLPLCVFLTWPCCIMNCLSFSFARFRKT
jgi:hypothetical protein